MHSKIIVMKPSKATNYAKVVSEQVTEESYATTPTDSKMSCSAAFGASILEACPYQEVCVCTCGPGPECCDET